MFLTNLVGLSRHEKLLNTDKYGAVSSVVGLRIAILSLAPYEEKRRKSSYSEGCQNKYVNCLK